MQVQYTRLAISDLTQAYKYISSDSLPNARLTIGRIEKSIETLLSYPLLGKKGRVAGTREFVVVNTPFVVIYRVKVGVLQILSILHASKKYP